MSIGLSSADSWPVREPSDSASPFGVVVMVDYFFFSIEDFKFKCCFAGSASKFCGALYMACDKASQKRMPNVHYVKTQVKTFL